MLVQNTHGAVFKVATHGVEYFHGGKESEWLVCLIDENGCEHALPFEGFGDNFTPYESGDNLSPKQVNTLKSIHLQLMDLDEEDLVADLQETFDFLHTHADESASCPACQHGPAMKEEK